MQIVDEVKSGKGDVVKVNFHVEKPEDCFRSKYCSNPRKDKGGIKGGRKLYPPPSKSSFRLLPPIPRNVYKEVYNPYLTPSLCSAYMNR